MDTSIIGEFSVLSPSQKRELERKRKEKEARRAAAYAKHDERMWRIEQKYLNA